jgi:6-phosphogluconolactonase (cycloisomerase 2 family)
MSATLVALAIVLNGDPPSVLIVPYSTIVGDVQRSKSVSVYKIDATTGDLTLAAGSPFAAGAEPTTAAFAPGGRFAYVINKESGNVSAYKVEARTGTLMQVRGSPFALDYSPGGPISIVVDPRGRHAYVVTSMSISAFSIDAATGRLAPVPGSPFARSEDFGITSLAVDPSDRFAYVLNYSSNTISTYEIDGAGALKLAGRPLDAGQNGNDAGFSTVTIDPKGKFAYVTGNENKVYVYAIDATTGALTPSAHLSLGEPGVFDLAGFAIDLTGSFAYAVDSASNRVDAYSINATTGRLKALDRLKYSRAAGSEPHGLTIDSTGAFIYVFNPRTIYGYRIDSASGQLMPLARSPFSIAANTTDPVARWFTTGLCAALSNVTWSGAHPPPVAKRESGLIDRFTPIAPGYFYDPALRVALHYPRGDTGGFITLRMAAEPPREVQRRDLSRLQTASGIKLGSRAETVVNTLGEPQIIDACNEQGYFYLSSRVGEPLLIEFTISNGIVNAISWERGG